MTTSSWRIPLAALLVAAAATASLRSQTPRPMGIVDLLNVPRLTEPQVSPDGTRRAVHARRFGLEGRQTDHAHLAGARRRRPGAAVDERRRRRDRRRGGRRTARRSRSSRSAAPTSSRRCIVLARRRRRSASADDARHRGLRHRLDAGRRGAVLHGGRPEDRRRKGARAARKTTSSRTTRTSSRRTCGKSPSRRRQERGSPSGDFSVTDYRRCRDDGAQDRATTARRPRCSATADKGEVWVMNADGSSATQLTKNAVAESGAELSPDSSQVLFLSGSNAKFDTYYNGRLFVVPAARRRGARARRRERAVRRRPARCGRGTASRSTSSPTSACTSELFRSPSAAARRSS